MMIKRRFDSFFRLILNTNNTAVPALKYSVICPVPVAAFWAEEEKRKVNKRVTKVLAERFSVIFTLLRQEFESPTP